MPEVSLFKCLIALYVLEKPPSPIFDSIIYFPLNNDVPLGKSEFELLYVDEISIYQKLEI